MKKTFYCVLLSLGIVVNSIAQQLEVSYSPSVYDKPFTGKVIAYLSKDNRSPKDGSIGFDPFPCFAVDVENIKPGQVIVIDDKATPYPTALSNIERGVYYVQIVWDRNMGGRSIAASPGNLYNPSVKINITKDYKQRFPIVATKIIPELAAFEETQLVKELKVPSGLLSTFKGSAMSVDAAVVLPNQYYTEPNRKFPVLYYVSGYGGDYHELSGMKDSPPNLIDSVPCIIVFLDGNCSLGHSVYANSDNNGPWGDALVKEFIPMLQNKFRCNGANLLSGHSSGGWTVLWLQTQYPKVFDGCWSSAPDPVDFRNFQQVNLYQDKNMFYGNDSSQNLAATVAGRIPWTTVKRIFQMENVVYRGEQMHSFNAVFSKKGKDGIPESICNNQTGVIDTAVFSNWKKYDIAQNLKNNWNALKASLDGKVRVSIGNSDNFLLNNAVLRLEKQMKELNSTFQFAYFPGDHFTVFTKEYKEAGSKFLKEKYLEWLDKGNKK